MAKRKPASTTKKSTSQELTILELPPQLAGPIVPAATAQTQTIVSNTKEDIVGVAVVTLEEMLDKQLAEKTAEHIEIVNRQAAVEKRLDELVDQEGKAFADANSRDLLSAIASITKKSYEIVSSTEFDRDKHTLDVTITIHNPKADNYSGIGDTVRLEAEIQASLELKKLLEEWETIGEESTRKQNEMLVVKTKKSNMYKYAKKIAARLTVASLRGSEEGSAMLDSVTSNLISILDEDSQTSLLMLANK